VPKAQARLALHRLDVHHFDVAQLVDQVLTNDVAVGATVAQLDGFQYVGSALVVPLLANAQALCNGSFSRLVIGCVTAGDAHVFMCLLRARAGRRSCSQGIQSCESLFWIGFLIPRDAPGSASKATQDYADVDKLDVHLLDIAQLVDHARADVVAVRRRRSALDGSIDFVDAELVPLPAGVLLFDLGVLDGLPVGCVAIGNTHIVWQRVRASHN
jgi:hypothetical protein